MESSGLSSTSWYNTTISQIQERLFDKGLLSKKGIAAQQRAYLSSLLWLGPKHPKEALDRFFEYLPYLMHPRFSGTALRRYTQWFKKVDQVRYPDWFECDTSELGVSLDALPVVEEAGRRNVNLASVLRTRTPVPWVFLDESPAGQRCRPYPGST